MAEIIEFYIPLKHKSKKWSPHTGKLLQFPEKEKPQEPKVEKVDGILITDTRRISDYPEI